MVVAAAPSPYWFITRATGVVALLLLSASVALGVAGVRRMAFGNTRFVVDALHRSASLLAVVFVSIHVVTTLLDGFAPIGIVDVVVPFHSAYRPVWLGLGAIGLDLMAAVTITSLLRDRVGYRAWRAIHWLAYLGWPLALVHSYGTGTDPKTHWMLVVTAICVAVVLMAVVARATAGWPAHLPARLTALATAALFPLGLMTWLLPGPLASGWALRAGTPPALVASARAAAALSGRAGSGASRGGARVRSLVVRASFRGRVRQQQLGPGAAVVDISLVVDDPRLRHVHIRIEGQAIPGGGVDMSDSQVSAGPTSNPDRFSGRVTALSGPTIQASLSDATGAAVALAAELQAQGRGGSATGLLTARSSATP
jgi:DMSO/TMAO reductase YedYZ heme-binding membrane subunit